jgi:hypothetical protein
LATKKKKKNQKNKCNQPILPQVLLRAANPERRPRTGSLLDLSTGKGSFESGLPDGIYFKPKFQIWVHFGGSCNVKFWCILWTFGIFFPVLVCCTKKNLATQLGVENVKLEMKWYNFLLLPPYTPARFELATHLRASNH